MKFLADENIPLEVCKRLVKKNIDIVSVSEIAAGASDKEIISLAQKNKRAIITFDKDFGELVFSEKVKIPGIILLRFFPRSSNFILKKIEELLSSEEITLEKHFIVVEEDRIRIREIK